MENHLKVPAAGIAESVTVDIAAAESATETGFVFVGLAVSDIDYSSQTDTLVSAGMAEYYSVVLVVVAAAVALAAHIAAAYPLNTGSA